MAVCTFLSKFVGTGDEKYEKKKKGLQDLKKQNKFHFSFLLLLLFVTQ